MGPQYLNEMFNYVNFNHFIHLAEPRVNSSYGDRSFKKVGPNLWNNLPLEVKSCTSLESFKTSLKTHLFKLAFDVPG